MEVLIVEISGSRDKHTVHLESWWYEAISHSKWHEQVCAFLFLKISKKEGK